MVISRSSSRIRFRTGRTIIGLKDLLKFAGQIGVVFGKKIDIGTERRNFLANSMADLMDIIVRDTSLTGEDFALALGQEPAIICHA